MKFDHVLPTGVVHRVPGLVLREDDPRHQPPFDQIRVTFNAFNIYKSLPRVFLLVKSGDCDGGDEATVTDDGLFDAVTVHGLDHDGPGYDLIRAAPSLQSLPLLRRQR